MGAFWGRGTGMGASSARQAGAAAVGRRQGEGRFPPSGVGQGAPFLQVGQAVRGREKESRLESAQHPRLLQTGGLPSRAWGASSHRPIHYPRPVPCTIQVSRKRTGPTSACRGMDGCRCSGHRTHVPQHPEIKEGPLLLKLSPGRVSRFPVVSVPHAPWSEWGTCPPLAAPARGNWVPRVAGPSAGAGRKVGFPRHGQASWEEGQVHTQ